MISMLFYFVLFIKKKKKLTEDYNKSCKYTSMFLKAYYIEYYSDSLSLPK